MANEDRPRGFVPVGHMTGGEIRPRMYKCDDTTSIYKGDVVSVSERGSAMIATAGDGHLALGVAAETVLSPVSENILVWDDPNIVYEVQGYTGVTFTEGDGIGCVGDHVANSADTTYNISRQELNTIAPYEKGAPAQFVCIGKVDRPGNAWGEHVKLLVKFYEHFTIQAAS
jgi:hypothetical protein